MYNIHPTDFLIFSFDREVSQSKVLFQYPLLQVPLFLCFFVSLIRMNYEILFHYTRL